MGQARLGWCLRLACTVGLVLIVVFAGPWLASAEQDGAGEGSTEGVWYTVRPGDILGTIALRHGTTVRAIAQANNIANPNLIRVGQRLWIPGTTSGQPSPSPTPSPTDPAPSPPTEPPRSEEVWYIVRSGDTLGGIAVRYGTTARAIAQANNIANPNLIRVGQRLLIPQGGSPAVPAPDPQPRPPVGVSFAYGFQIHPWSGANLGLAINATREAGFTWVKIQVPWLQVERGGKGQYDWGELDGIVGAIHDSGLQILVSICKAPGWARGQGTDMSVNGPPANPQDLADFCAALAARYKGRVQAIEVWNEQNLHYEWGNEPLDAARYVDLLCRAYGAIKAQDPSIVVVSGAPTPTGVNDGVIAVDDVVYLERMYRAGCKSCMDAVGAHPSGYNNPPTARYGYTDPMEPSFKGHPSFFFYETMTRYRQVMAKFGDSSRAIWPTEFGWASSAQPPRGYEYAMDVSEEERAQYLVEALNIMKGWGYVGPAFVWNLDYNLASPGSEQAIFAVWGKPAYEALKAMPK